MKRILISCTIFLLLCSSLSAQQDSTAKRFRHEFGIDISSILGGILVSTDFGFTTVESYDFPLSYRLYTPNVNVRAGLGVSSAKQVYSTFFSNNGLDTLEGSDLVINSKVGLEKMHAVGKRWAFFYGIDYEYSNYNDLRESKSVSQGYETEWRTEGHRHGISPFLGFRIQFNERVGLQTELKVTYSSLRQDLYREYTPIIPNPSNLPEDSQTYNINSGIDFIEPNFLILTIKL